MEDRIKTALKFAGWAHVGGFADDLAAAQSFQRKALATGHQAVWVVPHECIENGIAYTVKVKMA